SGSSPEALQRSAIGGFPQLLERPLSYLSDAFPRHTHQRPDLLEGHGLAALFEAVIEIENLALAGGQVYLEDAVDELTHQLAVGLLLDLAALLAGEALPQRGRVLAAPVHRSVERQLRRRHATCGADVLDRVLERHRDLVAGRPAPVALGQIGLGADHVAEQRGLIQRTGRDAG